MILTRAWLFAFLKINMRHLFEKPCLFKDGTYFNIEWKKPYEILAAKAWQLNIDVSIATVLSKHSVRSVL